MFPTHVGMNRLRFFQAYFCFHVPHTRGDEPWRPGHATVAEEMFPTHVGMNRCTRQGKGKGTHVPHTRGDEPPATSKNSVQV